MAEIKKTDETKGRQQLERSYVAGGNARVPFAKQLGSFL